MRKASNFSYNDNNGYSLTGRIREKEEEEEWSIGVSLLKWLTFGFWFNPLLM